MKLKKIPSKICPCCLKRFFRPKSISKNRWESREFCSSNVCRVIKLPIEEYKKQKLQHILSNAVITNSGCMEWQLSLSKGYGQIKFLGKMVKVHRLVWEIVNGILLEEEDLICHTCDNTKCINIFHLFKGTHQDNKMDSVNKGRHFHKLSEQDKKIIIGLAQEGILYKNIAKEFSVNQEHIGRIALQNGIRRLSR